MQSAQSWIALLVVATLVVSALSADVKLLNKNKHKKPFGVVASTTEPHLGDVRNITNGGTNAEAYFSFDGTRMSFQAIRGELAQTHPCDQIYTMNIDGSDIQLVSNGYGRDTCSYYTPDGNFVIYSSTRSGNHACPPIPDQAYGYVWPLYKDMEVYQVELASGKLTQLTNFEGYSAESTIAPDGSLIVFTSDFEGDLELYTMTLDGQNVTRRTYTPGYDGGAWFSWNSQSLVWRANRPRGDNLTNYLDLLELGMVEPLDMQIYVMMDINNPYSVVQLTNNGAVNFAPAWLPDDTGIIFSSNMDDPAEFHLYTIGLDGTNLERITFEGSFNAFPMFSPDGTLLAWESNRNTTTEGDINVLLANWID